MIDYDTAVHRARVKVVAGPETNWLRIWSPLAHTLWRLRVPLTPGDEVLVACPEGDINCGVILGGMFSSQFHPVPEEGDTQKSLVLEYEDGDPAGDDNRARIELTANGEIYLTTAQGAGTLVLGPMKGATDNEHIISLETLEDLYNNHTHPTPQGPSGPPYAKIKDNHKTPRIQIPQRDDA